MTTSKPLKSLPLPKSLLLLKKKKITTDLFKEKQKAAVIYSKKDPINILIPLKINSPVLTLLPKAIPEKAKHLWQNREKREDNRHFRIWKTCKNRIIVLKTHPRNQKPRNPQNFKLNNNNYKRKINKTTTKTQQLKASKPEKLRSPGNQIKKTLIINKSKTTSITNKLLMNNWWTISRIFYWKKTITLIPKSTTKKIFTMNKKIPTISKIKMKINKEILILI